MSEVALLGLISLIFRTAAVILFGIVIVKQIQLRSRNNDSLNRLRDLLISLTLIPFLFNFLSMYNNYVRFVDGQQNDVLNSVSFVTGAIASLATAIVLWLIYRMR